MKAEQKKPGWGFGLLWIAASIFGMYLGFMGGFFLGALLENNTAIGVAFGMSLGTGIGLMQWLVLHRHIPKSGWWILTNIAGIFGLFKTATSSFVYQAETIGPILIGTGLVALSGIVTGTLQWLILRQRVSKAGWWIPTCAVSWGICLPALDAGLLVQGHTSLIAGLALLGAGMGGILVWLLRQPTKNYRVEEMKKENVQLTRDRKLRHDNATGSRI